MAVISGGVGFGSERGEIHSSEWPEEPLARMGEVFDYSQWKLVWEDEFDYPEEELETNWTFQNGPSHSFVLCSRWRENASLKDGVLYLTNRKESRGGQDWTSASLWTKKRFKYGYYEARYKYAGADGTNNSFWLMPMGWRPKEHKWVELDINEGHYPNEINTNIHNWTDRWEEDGKEKHWDDPKPYHLGLAKSPIFTEVFGEGVKAEKVRLRVENGSRLIVKEFRVFPVSEAAYPQESEWKPGSGLRNLVAQEGVRVRASEGIRRESVKTRPENAIDGKVGTSWLSAIEGEKWLEVDFGKEVEVGAVQFVNGWTKGERWKGLLDRHGIEVFREGKWVEVAQFDSTLGNDFSKTWNTFGLMWNEERHDIYFNGRLIRSIPNEWNHSETNILLSLAILKNGIAGQVTDAIDGTSMKVDWVRYYQLK
ncbi:MAG: family 16 glycosylhydrolase [Verrucomicrobiota bacterium]